jgi:hypothetical protein
MLRSVMTLGTAILASERVFKHGKDNEQGIGSGFDPNPGLWLRGGRRFEQAGRVVRAAVADMRCL